MTEHELRERLTRLETTYQISSGHTSRRLDDHHQILMRHSSRIARNESEIMKTQTDRATLAELQTFKRDQEIRKGRWVWLKGLLAHAMTGLILMLVTLDALSDKNGALGERWLEWLGLK